MLRPLRLAAGLPRRDRASVRRILLLVVCPLAIVGCDCSSSPGAPGPAPSIRCEADLSATGLFSNVGNTARARVLGATDGLIGGQSADGRTGDVLLENDRLRVIVSQPGRHFGPIPFGGWIVDADLKRPEGDAGRDQFGRMGLLYAFGRTINTTDVQILDDGTAGGAAIVAVTGRDALNDFVHLKNAVGRFLPGNVLAIDPELPRPIKATTYYVLSPGESRVRVYTQFCNEGPEPISLPLGEIIDQGGSTEFFNPQGCSGSLGTSGCQMINPSLGFAFQGDGVAYGYRSYRADNLTLVSSDAVLDVGGAVGVLAGAEDASGVLKWLDPQAPRRPGTFAIQPGERRAFLRDFFVARDLAELTSIFLALDGAQRGQLSAKLEFADGSPAPGARLAVRGAGNRLVTVLIAGDGGLARADLAPGTYSAQAGLVGHALEPPISIQIGTSGTTERTFVLGPARTLTVRVQDPFGAPMPAKVTVLCPRTRGACPTPASKYQELFAIENVPTNVAAIGFVPPNGVLAIKLAPGAYEIVVTRGPEFSAFPEAWPLHGEDVDLTSTDQSVTATLARVVDTENWISADLHVHAVNSVDSSVANETRVMSFLAEGVDLLVATDHDVVTDYAPAIASLDAQEFIASMVGSEISTFDYGHFNAYPMVFRNEVHGGPFDWAGGADGPTMRPTQLFAGVRESHPDALLQLNHARDELLGALTLLRVDTDTFATHADPLPMRMSPAPDATPTDTRLFDENFDAIEVANGPTASTPLLNDWMTMLSSGRRKVATAVSDTHHAFTSLGGYSRTYVLVGADAPGELDPREFVNSLRGMRAIGTNGPFLRLTARRPDGVSVGIGETISITPGESLELIVDVQAPEWMRFDTLEVYTHADGREALDGQSNTADPAAHQKISVDPSTEIQAVPVNGQQFRRVHVVRTFVVQPAADTWYMVMLRSSGAGTLYPLAHDVNCAGGVCTADAAKPSAFTNPIFVDADGSGAYDNFPQKSRSIRAPFRSPPPAPARPPTLDDLASAIHRALEHHSHE